MAHRCALWQCWIRICRNQRTFPLFYSHLKSPKTPPAFLTFPFTCYFIWITLLSVNELPTNERKLHPLFLIFAPLFRKCVQNTHNSGNQCSVMSQRAPTSHWYPSQVRDNIQLLNNKMGFLTDSHTLRLFSELNTVQKCTAEWFSAKISA